MKKVKLFEQFVFEASNKKRIKEIQAELADINAEMEEVQAAMDNGDFDQDEAELRLNDLDGNKLDLEGELADLQKGDQDAIQDKIRPVVAKTIQAISELGAQSAKWSVMSKYAPADQKDQFKFLKERDDAQEAQDEAKVEKMIAKCDTFNDKMSPEMLALYSFAKGEYKSANNAFHKAGQALQGAKSACEEWKKGCDEVADRGKTYKEELADFQKAQAKLGELAKAADVRV